ncbi:MAG: rhodanese-like domain-containing protein [Planctomycetes bacterium]|nr:rhodanese-like domain-containing protein [Planctomycetota bacterium]
MNVPELSPRDAHAMRDTDQDLVLLDVRHADEHAAYHIDGARLLPLDELPQRLGELDPAARYLVVCERGGRSAAACAFLSDRGFRNVVNLRGGMSGWLDAELPVRTRDGTTPRRGGMLSRLLRMFGG